MLMPPARRARRRAARALRRRELDTDLQPAQRPDRRRIEPVLVFRHPGHPPLQERPEADETRRRLLGRLRPRGRRLRLRRGHLCVHRLVTCMEIKVRAPHAIDAMLSP